MKKQLLSFSLVMCLLGAIAQPTTHSVLPAIGANYSFNTVTGSITHPAGGANQNWQFNPLVNSTTLTYSVIPLSELTTTDLTTYPSANYATQSFLGNNKLSVNFSAMQATKLVPLGERGSGGNYNNQPTGAMTYSYGMSLNSSITFTTVYFSTNSTITIKCDGTGTITTPFGTYNNALRIKKTELGNPDTSYTYYDTQPTIRPLLLYVHKQNGTVTNKFVYDWTFIPTLPTAINANNKEENDINVYPNPADNFISISGKEQIKSISIYNQLGQSVLENNTPKINTIDVSQFPNGIYFIRISSNKGTLIQKIIKQ